MTYYFRSTPNSSLQIKDSTTPIKIITGVRWAGDVFLKHCFISNLRLSAFFALANPCLFPSKKRSLYSDKKKYRLAIYKSPKNCTQYIVYRH